MTRTALLKLGNFAVLGMLFGSTAILELVSGHPLNRTQSVWRGVVVVSALLIIFTTSRKLFASIRYLRRRDLANAITSAAAYLADVRAHPWKRLLFLFQCPVFTTSPQTAALMVIGRAHILAGEPKVGLKFLVEASEIDPRSPTAHVALYQVASILNDECAAANHLNQAYRLGYSGSFVDRIFGAGEILAAKMVLPPPQVGP